MSSSILSSVVHCNAKYAVFAPLIFFVFNCFIDEPFFRFYSTKDRSTTLAILSRASIVNKAWTACVVPFDQGYSTNSGYSMRKLSVGAEFNRVLELRPLASCGEYNDMLDAKIGREGLLREVI
jgi:hypothetical protein